MRTEVPLPARVTIRPPETFPNHESPEPNEGSVVMRTVLLLLMLALTAGCDDATGPEETLVYFPLTVGSEWTYAPPRAEFGNPFPWRVTERSGDTVLVDRPEYGSHHGPVPLLEV
jgi:hypothetical protein